MLTNLEISQEVYDRLINESIGTADIADDKLVDKAAGNMTHPTSTVLPTFGLC